MRLPTSLLLLLTVGMVSAADVPNSKETAKVEAVQSEDLPAVVRNAMKRVAKGAELSQFQKISGATGKVVYTASYQLNGKDSTVTVSEDGKVVRHGHNDHDGSGKK